MAVPTFLYLIDKKTIVELFDKNKMAHWFDSEPSMFQYLLLRLRFCQYSYFIVELYFQRN